MLRRLCLVLPIAGMAGQAMAQDQTPQQFVQAIYEPYRKAGFKGQPYWEVRRFFGPDLAQAIERDMAEAKRRKEVPTLDGDPFIDAQDWQITALSYSSAVSGDKAGAAVSFVNSGEPKGIFLALVKTAAGWRIYDIMAPSGSLRALYKLK